LNSYCAKWKKENTFPESKIVLFNNNEKTISLCCGQKHKNRIYSNLRKDEQKRKPEN